MPGQGVSLVPAFLPTQSAISMYKAILSLTLLLGIHQSAAATCSELDDIRARLVCFDRLAECRLVELAIDRLACYDERTTQPEPARAPTILAPRVSSEPSVPPVVPAPESAPVPAQVPASVPVDDAVPDSKIADDDKTFPVKGKRAKKRNADDLPSVEATITRVRTNRAGIVYVYLDNGQVWRETARSRFRYESGLNVVITEGALGSTNLHADGMKKFAKVERVN